MSRRILLVTGVVALALALGVAPAIAATYYVSPGGSDSAAGTSQATAWRTVGKVNSTALQPGDTVLFQAGATFGDATLMPSRSGTSAAPITFSSYGSGQATIANADGAVWFSGKSWLVFANLRLTAAGTSSIVFGGSSGAGSDHITLADSDVTGTTGIGVTAPNTGDSNWTISGSTIEHTGDSGLIMLGGPHTITHNTITDTGSNAAITWGKHGIYSKGPDQTISYNDFSRNEHGQAVSIRFHGARVIGNTIHDTSSAISFFDYDTAAPPQGTSYVYGNRAWNITGTGFYYDGQLDPQGRAPTVDFVVASNTFQLADAAAEAVNVSPSGSARVTLANNVFLGTYGHGLRTAATTVEHHNLFSGGTSFIPSGSGDLRVSPSLSASPSFVPAGGSPVIDAGTTAGVGLTYSSSCDGTPLSYCGAAPDLGAVEATGSSPAALAAPSGLVPTLVGQTSVTLSWSPSGDPRVGGYEVLRSGSVVASAALPIATVTGLACGTSYSFSVRSTGTGTTSSAASTTVATAACDASASAGAGSTPAPASGGGGGGGGGSPPEIAVSLAFGPQPNAVGDQFDYSVSLYNDSIQGSDKTVLTVKLPAAVQLVEARVTRGPGCSAAGQTLTCPLDYFPGKLRDNVVVTVKVAAAGDLTATASVWSMPADSNPANDTATAAVTLGATSTASTLGSYSTAPAAPRPAASAPAVVETRSLQTAPRSGATVKPRFAVVAKSPASVKAVSFVLDGRTACVDRARPFRCALKARPGWHTVTVRPIGGKATLVRLRVAS